MRSTILPWASTVSSSRSNITPVEDEAQAETDEAEDVEMDINECHSPGLGLKEKNEVEGARNTRKKIFRYHIKDI
jgi:hypothetical protein